MLQQNNDVPRSAAKAALRLYGGDVVAIVKESPDAAFARIPAGDLVELLSDKSDKLRASIAKKIVRSLPWPRAKQTLKSYIARDQCFCNAIFWLDLTALSRDQARTAALRSI